MRYVKNGIFSFLIIFLLSSLTSNFYEYRKNMTFYEDYKKEYELEQKKNTELHTKIIKNSDKTEIEKTIRDKLNLLRKGEIAIIIPPPSPTPTIFQPTPAPIYQQWINVMFKTN
ncbi:MAG: septum formation initiator family protein [Candidatus Roizmanbacteria bacterium]